MAPRPRRLPRAAAHAFVADLTAPELAGEDHRHLQRVLRLRPGQAVTVSDGAGRWRPCRWAAGGRLEPTGPAEEEDRAHPPITVAFALTKGARPDWTVQKLTEVGVDVIVGFRAARSVVHWDGAKASEQVGRWRRVAREAAMQSRRVRLPEVRDIADFGDLLGGAGVALAVPGGGPPSLERPTVLVGPEGGWAEEELVAVTAKLDLGPTVLRSETAAVAAGLLLCALREGTIRPSGQDPD